MEDNLLIYLLSGIFGGELAKYIAENNRIIKISPILLYAICFSLLYSIAAGFSAIVYLLKGYEIGWKGIGIFSMSVSFVISICIYFLDKIRSSKK
ncbi:hypothetical protein ACFPVS_05155 [Neisseria weixii]|uniref:hypothetical protein n=1 Tax=Neisseria weixii TaxID=1853276 RepID=UPI000BB8C3C8|nr:hypothetical protein [Neisseria weixii]ATD65746.1 hypothetical protein CGZ65_11650 [Neisseria weixii]